MMMLTGACASRGTWIEGHETVLFPATETLLEDRALRLRADFPLGISDAPVFAIPVGNGNLSLDVLSVSLRSVQSGRVLSSMDLEGGEREELIRAVRRQMELEDYGFLRRVRVAKLRLRGPQSFNFEGEPWGWESVDVRVGWEENPRRGSARDPHMKEGLWRTLLENLLVAPHAIDKLKQDPPEIAGNGPTSWQPGGAGRKALVKFSLQEEGLYYIDGSWLSGAGLDIAALEPDRLALFSEGRQVPVMLHGPENARFNQGRRLLFYGVGNDSPETKDRSYFLELLPEGMVSERPAVGPRVDDESPELIIHRATNTKTFDDVFKTRMGSFLSVRVMAWVGPAIRPGGTMDVSLDFPSLTRRGEDAGEVKLGFLFYPDEERTPNVPVRIEYNGEVVGEGTITATDTVVEVSLTPGMMNERGNRFVIHHDGDSESPRTRMAVHLERIDKSWPSMLEARGGRLLYTTPFNEHSPTGSHKLRTIGLNPARTVALDITDPESPVLLETVRDRANTIVHGELTEGSRILMQDNLSVQVAPAPRNIEWVDLANPAGKMDMIVLHHGIFSEAAELLATDLRESGIPSRAISTEVVYNNFSHGNLSSTAIRDFLAHAVHRWDSPLLGVILIGDGNADGRNFSRHDIPNLLPVPLLDVMRSANSSDSYSSDTYYTWLNEGDELVDLLLGRIPASSPEDALAAVHNIRVYRAAQKQPVPWGNRLLMIADTGNFQENLERMDDRHVKRDFETTFVFADEFAWEDNYYLPAHLLAREEDSKVSPLVTNAIARSFNDGVAVVSFLGHGAPNLWSNQRFWFGGGTPNSDILTLENKGRLPYVTSFTCNNAVIDYPLPPWNISIAQDFLRHRDKGAIACFMPSGPGYLRDHNVMGACFFRTLTILDIRNHGVLAELSRLGHQFHRSQDDQARMFLFLGDPTLYLPKSTNQTVSPPLKGREKEAIQSGRDMLLQNLTLNPEGDGLEYILYSVVENAIQEENQASWVFRLMDPNGEVVLTRSGEVTAPPLGMAEISVPVEVPHAGFWMHEMELVHSSAKWYREDFPTRNIKGTLYIQPDTTGGLTLIPGSMELIPSTSRSTDQRLTFVILNEAGEPLEGRVEVDVLIEGMEPVRREFNTSRLAPGRFQRVADSLPIEPIIDKDVYIQVRLFGRDDEEPVLYKSANWVIRPEAVPNLLIIPESIGTSPTPLSDGLTVFVHATVKNMGGNRSPLAEMGLYREEDTDFSRPLRDITGRRGLSTLHSLHPGEERRVQLRWDPFQNAGHYDLLMMVDPRHRLLETEKASNKARVPVRVKTKWDLVAGDIRLARGEEGRTLLLLGQVTNRGETPARRVSVNFYRTQEQTPETLLGEILLEEVAGGGVELAVFEWEPSREEVEATDFNPSFSIALKGSQRRVSSVQSDTE